MCRASRGQPDGFVTRNFGIRGSCQGLRGGEGLLRVFDSRRQRLYSVYVGQATKMFKQECFNPANLHKYAAGLADYKKGSPVMFLGSTLTVKGRPTGSKWRDRELPYPERRCKEPRSAEHQRKQGTEVEYRGCHPWQKRANLRKQQLYSRRSSISTNERNVRQTASTFWSSTHASSKHASLNRRTRSCP